MTAYGPRSKPEDDATPHGEPLIRGVSMAEIAAGLPEALRPIRESGWSVGDASEWWRCPNGTCEHGAILHDSEGYDDPAPTCCAYGCRCGRTT